MSMQTILAADLLALRGTEMTASAVIGVTTYTVFLDDLQSVDADAFGGMEIENMRKVHFLTADLASIVNGTTMTLLEPSATAGSPIQRKKIVLSSVISACGAELIVTVRGA